MKCLSLRSLGWIVLIGVVLLVSVTVVLTFVDPPLTTDFDRLRIHATDIVWPEAPSVTAAPGTPLMPEPTVVLRLLKPSRPGPIPRLR